MHMSEYVSLHSDGPPRESHDNVSDMHLAGTKKEAEHLHNTTNLTEQEAGETQEAVPGHLIMHF